MTGKDTRNLPLYGTGEVALIDERDYLRLARHRWLLDRYYAYRNRIVDGRWRKQGLAHAVLDLPRLSRVEFVNGNTLDCRRANLRAVLGFVYVNRKSNRNPYRVQFSIDDHQFDCGGWPRRDEAEEARAALSPLVASLRGRSLSRREIQARLDAETGRAARRYAGEGVAAELMRFASTLAPSHLPAEVREEVAQAVTVDLLSGVVTRDELDARRVRRYVKDAFGLRDAYRFRSLDAPTNDEDGRTLGETLAA